MAQAAIKVGQAFIPIEVDFTGVNAKVAKAVSRTMNYASKSAVFPFKQTAFAAAAPAFTRALTKANFNADALFQGKFSNRLNKGFSRTIATALSRTSAPLNANLFSSLSSSFQKAFTGRVDPKSVFKGGIGGFGAIGTTAAQAFAASFTVAGALTARTGIKSFGEFERAQLGLTSMLKSADKANKLLKEIQDFAVVSPFNVQNLLDASKQLVAFRFESDEILPLMKDIGDAAAALGTGDEGIQRMIRAMGQIKVKGRVMAEELLQLTEIGVSAPHFIAEHLGITTEEALKRVNKGQIDAATGIEALRKGIQKNFGGAIEAQQNTLFGLWSNLKDQFEVATRLLFTPISEDSKGFLRGAIDRLEKLKKWAETEWPAIVQKFREDPKGAIRDVAKRMYESFSKQNWKGAFSKIRSIISGGLDLAKEIPFGDLWRGFRGKAWDAYQYVKGLDWAGIWGNIERFGANFAASIRSYDWKGLGQTLKGEFLDAWETGKNIASYLKEKFDQVNWGDTANSIADKLGSARQQIVDKLQGALDVAFTNAGQWIDQTDWENVGRVAGTNLADGLKWAVSTAFDIGQWIVDKIVNFDYKKHFDNAGEFLTAAGQAFTSKIFNIDEEKLKEIPRKISEYWDAIQNDPEGAKATELKLNILSYTDKFHDAMKALGQTINDEVNKLAVSIHNYDIDDKKMKEAGEKSANAFGFGFDIAADNLNKMADSFDVSYEQQEGATIKAWDTLADSIANAGRAKEEFSEGAANTKSSGFKKFAAAMRRYMMKIGQYVVNSIFGVLGGTAKAAVNAAATALYETFGPILELLGFDSSGLNVRAATGKDKGKLFVKNKDDRDNVFDLLKETFGHSLYNLNPGVSLEEKERNNFRNPNRKVAPSELAPGARPRGKSAGDTRSNYVEIHQHFDGRYIEPEQAKRAGKLGVRAGV